MQCFFSFSLPLSSFLSLILYRLVCGAWGCWRLVGWVSRRDLAGMCISVCTCINGVFSTKIFGSLLDPSHLLSLSLHAPRMQRPRLESIVYCLPHLCSVNYLMAKKKKLLFPRKKTTVCQLPQSMRHAISATPPHCQPAFPAASSSWSPRPRIGWPASRFRPPPMSNTGAASGCVGTSGQVVVPHAGREFVRQVPRGTGRRAGNTTSTRPQLCVST